MTEDNEPLAVEFQRNVENLSTKMACARDTMMQRIIRLEGYEPDRAGNAEWRRHFEMRTLGAHAGGFRQAIYVDGKVHWYIDERIEGSGETIKLVLQLVPALATTSSR